MPDDIKEIEVCNPLEIGKSFDSKNFFLDLKIEFNNNTIVNLEMQILNRGNWQERSLSYLCRSFDNLNKVDDVAMQSVANIMYEYNEEEKVRDMCRAREEAVAFEAFIKEEKERFQGELEELERLRRQIL